MPVTGSTNLPVAPRDTPWDGPAARRRILEACGDVACLSRGFLWRDPDADPLTQAAWALGYTDWIDGRLRIVPRGIAAAAGGRGVGALRGVSDADKARIRTRICAVYTTIRRTFEDWPDCPFSESDLTDGDEFRKRKRKMPMESIRADATGQEWEGIIALEGETTGDQRRIRRGALRWENGPWPLVYDGADMDHSGRVVGTVDEISREGSRIMARGHLSDSEDPQTAADVARVRELLAEGAVGVSILTDDEDWDVPEPSDEPSDEPMVLKGARIRHVAIVDVPAFDRARIALVAAADPGWFTDPRFGRTPDDDPRLVWQEPERPEEVRQPGCPLTIDDTGRIYGHFALWGRCHIGYAGTCVRPPKEPASFRGFLTGERVQGVPTGPLVMRTTHAGLSLHADAAQAHYAHTGYAVADVTVGADEHGLWAAGALRSGATEHDREVLRSSALSGDWREVGGRHRLIGLLVVNAPGFRVARALAASAALITSGPGCETCDDRLALEDRVARLEAMLVARGESA